MIVGLTDFNQLSGIGAMLACGIAVLALWAQRSHNKLSVRPLPEIVYRDMADEVCIALKNHGTGPLIIEYFRVCKHGREVGASLIDLMPAVGNWRFFVGNIDGRSIPVGGEIVLLHFEAARFVPDPAKVTKIRRALKHLSIHVVYQDVYRGSHPVYIRSLEWFGRPT